MKCGAGSAHMLRFVLFLRVCEVTVQLHSSMCIAIYYTPVTKMAIPPAIGLPQHMSGILLDRIRMTVYNVSSLQDTYTNVRGISILSIPVCGSVLTP